MRKKLSSLLLAVSMCVSMLPMAAFAAETQPSVDDPLDNPSYVRDFASEEPESNIGDMTFGAEAKKAVYSKYTNKSYMIPSNCTARFGIDVSRHNGDIDWSKVKADGVEFAFVRVAYRTVKADGKLYEDSKYVQNLKGAIGAGIPTGVYIYSQALTEQEAIAEAQYTLKLIEGYNVTLPIVMDYEFYDGTGRLDRNTPSQAQMTKNAQAFCKVVRDAGRQPMIYAGKGFLTKTMDWTKLEPDIMYWLANWTTNTNYTGKYQYWQYSDTGRVNGVSGTDIDCNIFLEKPGQTMNGKPQDSVSSQMGTAKPQVFPDVANDAWYKDAAAYVKQNSIMKGDEDGYFDPEGTMSRAMLVQTLYNYAKPTAVPASCPFTDVPKGEWYYDAVSWAAENRITTGVGDGLFEPDEPISREQFVKLLYAYSKEPTAKGSLTAFPDHTQVSSWAVIPMQWAVENGIVRGSEEEDGSLRLNPGDSITRAEAATVMMNYIEQYVKKKPA